MCCRYYFDQKTLEDTRRITDQPLQSAQEISFGDIHPADPSIIIRREDEKLIAETMKWGFTQQDKKLLINARSETVFEKKIFSESVRYRRCIVPAGKFYEWDRRKTRNTFSAYDGRTIFMAGIYDMFDNAPRFTIITTAANQSMEPVHDRMPLIFPEKMVRDWILDDRQTAGLLSFQPEMLRRKAAYEQISLFDMM